MIFKFLILSFALLLVGSVYGNENENPSVETPFGKILGTYSKSFNGKRYAQFLSVPYAEAPVGNLRFKEPQPLKKWTDTWIANYTIICAQWSWSKYGGEYIGQEDCLYSNIFVPSRQISDKLLDVIIDIHGGGLNFGSNVFYSGPKYIMDRDVILVVINYRLGPLGFISTEDEVVPGNNGMKDQVAAIKWVKENIQYFGGNPESITLTGLSAGGASVQMHYMSPLSKGLFKGGISLSGNALCPWPLQENALQQTRQLASAVGCNQVNTTDLINCMRQRHVKQICESTKIFRPWLYNPFSVFGIVVEKHGKNPFLSKHPYELLVNGKIHDLPWITSVVSHEGLFPVAEFIIDDNHLKKLDTDWNELAPHLLHFEHTIHPQLKEKISKKIREYYFKNKAISSETAQKLIELASDRLFLVDAEKSARLQAQANKSPTYFYYFSYEGEEVPSFTEAIGLKFKTRPGICHGDDMRFIFNLPDRPLDKFTKNDLKMQAILLDIWTSFAHSGKPNVSGVEWKSISNKPNQPLDYLHIESPSRLVMQQTEELGNRRFWDSLKFKENNGLFPLLTKDEL